MEQLCGVVTGITFRNEKTGFAVIRLKEDSTGSQHTCVGIMPSIEKGESVILNGHFEKNAKFGSQFSVSSFELSRPTTKNGILMLLGSGLIPNIGPSRAETIVEKFGIKTLEILDNTPDRLLEIPGIGKKTLSTIKEAWNKQGNIRDLLLFLQQHGITINLANKIYQTYGIHAKEKLSENPYVMIDDIRGVGFKKTDTIAKKLGFEQDSYKRIRAGIIFVIQESAGNGHTCLPSEELLKNAVEILETSPEKVRYSLDHMIKEEILILENKDVYLPKYYRAEVDVAKILTERVKNNNIKFDLSKLDFWLKDYSKRINWQGDKKQIEAVRLAVKNQILILTGGPGTGKTTTLQIIVDFFRSNGTLVALTAPTGRAAQRMGSIAGIKATTIHRLLEFKPTSNGFDFLRNKSNPIPADVVIVDEVSMIDIVLMRNLLNGLRSNAKIILVGDCNQLPSVGAGNVLSDMISSKSIPHINLTKIFRQAASSKIVTVAHDIINGNYPKFTNASTDDCFFINKFNSEDSLETIIDLVSRRLPNKYGFDPIRDIQILSPMHKGLLGTQSLNNLLQSKLNSSKQTIKKGNTVFAKNDKVMQINNNYDKNVFNGDIGYVASIIDGLGLTVDYDGNVVQYEIKELDEITHAYCISIHKSQGCEFKAVIIPVTLQHFVMLQRNLFYTALTRAKKLCVVVGNPKALGIAINKNNSIYRYSNLAKRIS